MSTLLLETHFITGDSNNTHRVLYNEIFSDYETPYITPTVCWSGRQVNLSTLQWLAGTWSCCRLMEVLKTLVHFCNVPLLLILHIYIILLTVLSRHQRKSPTSMISLRNLKAGWRVWCWHVLLCDHTLSSPTCGFEELLCWPQDDVAVSVCAEEEPHQGPSVRHADPHVLVQEPLQLLPGLGRRGHIRLLLDRKATNQI